MLFRSILFRDEVVRGFLHVFTAFLNVWRHNDFGASLDRVLEPAGEGLEIRDGDDV